MKKTIALIATIAALAMSACSNGISDLDSEEKAPAPVAEESVAQYRYLGVMYNSTEGKKLNDEALQGKMYDVYRDKVQIALNVYMHFPLDGKVAPQGFAGSIVNAITGAPQASLYETDWYDTLPPEIKKYITDTMAEGIAKGIAQYLNSEEGQATVNGYLDNVQNRANQVVEHGVDELQDEFQDEIDTMVGVFCASSVVAALSGTMFVEPVMLVSMFMNHSEHGQIMGKLRQIQRQLVEIQNALRNMEHTLDIILGIELEDYFQALAHAQGLVTDIYNQLGNLPDESGRKELIDSYIRTSLEYERIYREAFEKAQQHVAKYEEVNGISKVDIPVKITYRCYGGDFLFTYDFSFKINSPMHVTKYTLQDIALLKRLSETRLSLAEEIYNGNQLLSFRSEIAKQDLLKLNNIKSSLINNPLQYVNNYLDTILIKEYTGYFPSLLCDLVNMMSYQNDGNITANYYQNNGGVPGNSITEFNILINNNSICFYQEHLGDPGMGGITMCGPVLSTEGDVPDKTEFINKMISTIEDQIYKGAYNDYFVQALTMLADWEIRLKAHIKAAEGL